MGRIAGHFSIQALGILTLFQSTHAMVIDDIGNDEDGAPIEILFGALAMQQWGIRLIPEQEKLDLSHYPEEFLEF